MMTDGLTADEGRLIAAIEARADELVALLRDLVRAPSVNPPGDTSAAAQVVIAWLERHGLAHEVAGSAPERPSVVARLQLGAPGRCGRRGRTTSVVPQPSRHGAAGQCDGLER